MSEQKCIYFTREGAFYVLSSQAVGVCFSGEATHVFSLASDDTWSHVEGLGEAESFAEAYSKKKR